MKRILCNKTGVTILEGLIALGLLALVSAGTFGVLLSVSRKAGSPDIREEMAYAVEKAHNQLQMYTPSLSSDLINPNLPYDLINGLCGGDGNPFGSGTHYINCMLPPICDQSRSSFYYTVGDQDLDIPFIDNYNASSGTVSEWGGAEIAPLKKVEFFITCNGFTL